MARPDDALVKQVLSNLHTAEDVDYFFDQLKSPEWIDPLEAAGMFSSPPEPVEVEGGGVYFPFWSASKYLSRMAETAPEIVLPVLLRLPEVSNVRVMHDVADAALALPAAMSVKLLPTMSSWLGQPFQMLLPTKLAALLQRWSLGGMPDAAMALARTLFGIRQGESFSMGDGFEFPAEPVSTMEAYEYEQLLDACAEDFVSGTGIAGLDLLAELLVQAVESDAEGNEGGKRDYSYIWRPAIEPHSQNSVPSVRNAIISAVRNGAILLACKSRKILGDVVKLLEDKEWSVLRRIALDVLRQCAPKRSAAVSSRLTSTRIFDRDLHHEYWMLLHDRFRFLTPNQQESVVRLIRRGPNVYRDPEGPYAESGEGTEALEWWQAGMLAAIRDDLSEDLQSWFEDLISRRGISEHPEFLSYTSGGWTGPTSPIDQSDFQAMSEDELIEYLRTWEPEPGWAKPSSEGLGRTLTAAVTASPSRFAEYAPKFRGLDPTYVNAILSAYRGLATNKQGFPWEPILQLATWVVDQDRVVPGRNTEYGEDQGWVWTRSTISHLLSAGFNTGPAEIPFELRSFVWSALQPLTEDPDPTDESEARYGGSNMDPFTLAINTVRGQALEATANYATWVHRHLEDGHDQPVGFERMPEVRDVLDRHLDLEIDPSRAVRAIYGNKFPWLQLVDPSWADENVPVIFPPDEDKLLYWEAAWDAYVSYCPPYDSVLEALKGEYYRAISRLETDSGDRKRSVFGGVDQIARHLMVFYLRGRLDLNDPLLEEFFRSAPAALRAAGLRSLGRGLYDIAGGSVRDFPSPIPDAATHRAIALWESRLDVARSADNSEGRAEVAEFGWWFVAPSFDPDWALTQLDGALRVAGTIEAGHLVAKRLAELVETRPMPVLGALELMVRGDREGWKLMSWKDSVTSILRSALSSPDSNVQRRAVDLTQELGAKGYREFRSLLQERES